MAAADHLTQAAARTWRLLRDAGRAARRGPTAGTPPGELRGLVAAHLAAYPAEDFGPHPIGRVLGRSAGAVVNALDRLTASARRS
jgi:plasmid stabilization system protein ParE